MHRTKRIQLKWPVCNVQAQQHAQESYENNHKISCDIILFTKIQMRDGNKRAGTNAVAKDEAQMKKK